MNLTKEAVLDALKSITAPGEGVNIVGSGAVTNVMVFGDEVDVDITLKNPSLQARKKNGSEYSQNHSRAGVCQGQDQDKSQGGNAASNPFH